MGFSYPRGSDEYVAYVADARLCEFWVDEDVCVFSIGVLAVCGNFIVVCYVNLL